jgi:hypothetical protein
MARLWNPFAKKAAVSKDIEADTIENKRRPASQDYFFELNRSMMWGAGDTQIGVMELYQMRVYSDILQNVLNTLRNEIFRKGIEAENLRPYENNFQKAKIERLKKKANYNGQTMKEVLMEIEDDINIIDDGYLLARKNYLINAYNEIIGAEVQEFIRIHPISVEMIFDDTSRLGYDKEGQEVFFDVEDRTQLTHDRKNKNGIPNLRACFKVKSTKDGQYHYYDTSELLHVSKYHPTKLYGFSPLYSLNNKVMTLINMDYYIRQYYSGNKVPKGMLFVNTSNSKSFMAFWDEFLEKIRLNPHAVHPLVHQSPEGKDPVKWIDFMRSLQEMQYTDVRNEMRVSIGAVYNVSPIFQNDTSTGGGLNNEGLQITVTDRGVEMGQAVYNEKVFPWIAEQLGITDFELKLPPSKEIDEMHEKDLRLKDLEIAKATADLGIATKMNEDGEFSYTPGVVKVTQASPFAPAPATFPQQDPEQQIEKSCQGTSVEKTNSPPPTPATPSDKEVESALVNELEKLLRQFDTKTRPSKEELDRKISETVKNFDKVVKTKSAAKLKAIYRKAMEDLGKDLGRTFTLNEQDKNVIEALKRAPVYEEAFAAMSASLSDKLKESVTQAYEQPDGFNVNSIVENMRENTDAIESDLRRIARTETTKISCAARKVQYDKTGLQFKYYHVGPDDDRTTAMSKEAKALTKNGVSWDEYVNIIEKVAHEHNPKWIVNREAPITHPNTRHIFVARPV